MFCVAELTLGAATTNISTVEALIVSLTNAANGDIIQVRAGTYASGGLIFDRTNVTLRSYPGEAVVFTDGVFGTLQTTMTTGTTAIVISGTETWPSAVNFSIGDEILYPLDRTSPSNYTVLRGHGGTTNRTHAIGDRVITFASYLLSVTGSSNIIQGIEFASVMTSNRQLTASWGISPGVSMNGGRGNKLADCVIHDVGHPAITPDGQGSGGELNGLLVYSCGTYDWYEYTGTPRGSGVYGNNPAGRGVFTVTNCVFVRNITTGAQMFSNSSGTNVWDVLFADSVSFNNGDAPFQIVAGADYSSNNVIRDCLMLGSPRISFGTIGDTAQGFYNNTVVAGSFAVINATNGVFTNNLVLMTPDAGLGASAVSYATTYYNSNQLSFTWDWNTYALGSNSSPYQFGFSALDVAAVNSLGGGTLMFDDAGKGWTNWSGFDRRSTYLSAWPTNVLTVKAQRLAYNSAKTFVAVLNTTGATNATLDLASLGFIAGQRYILRDAQNYFTELASGTYSGSALTLPLWQTNVSAIPGVTNFVNKHTNVDYPGLFNAFVLERTGASVTASGGATFSGGATIQ